MLALISPAKKLDFETDPSIDTHTHPDLLDRAEKLVVRARNLSRSALAQTMKLSDTLAELNYQRYQTFKTPFTLANAKQAALVFNGDTYVGLDAKTLSERDLIFAQDHLRILSGLYGLLRPLDLIQPYRLEMGAKFQPPHAANLYEFWGDTLGDEINAIVTAQGHCCVVNCASKEYFKAVKPKKLAVPVITPVFKEVKDNQARVIGLFAKQARGMMARYIIVNRLKSCEDLKSFKSGGYTYREDLSEEFSWVFTRPQP